MPTTAKSRYSKLPPQKATHLINSLLGSTCNLNSLLLGCLTIKCKCKRLNTGQRLPSRGGGGIRWGNLGIDGKYNLLLNGLAGRENTRDPHFVQRPRRSNTPALGTVNLIFLPPCGALGAEAGGRARGRLGSLCCSWQTFEMDGLIGPERPDESRLRRAGRSKIHLGEARATSEPALPAYRGRRDE